MDKIRNFLKPKENVFITIFFVFGLLFVFVTPPIYTHDESTHLYRAYQVSTFKLVPDNIGDEAGGNVPKSLTNFVSENILTPGQKYHYFSSMKAQLSQRLNPNNQDSIPFTNVAIYPFVNYLPQALGLGLARIFTQSIWVQFFAARIFNLVFLGLCLYFALKIIGKNKEALFVIGLLPMVLYLGASLSADTFVLGSTALFVSYLYSLFRQKNIDTKQWIIVGCLAAAVALSKQTYFVLIFALLALPFRNVKFSKKEFVTALGVIAAALIPFALTLVSLRHVHTQPTALQHSVGVFADPKVQEKFMLTHPFGFIKASLSTLRQPGLLAGFFGEFGVGDIALQPWALAVAIIALFLSFGYQDKKERTANKPTIIFWLVALTNVAFIFAGLYIFWSNPHQSFVEQLQARYLIPTLILLMPALIGRYRHTIKWRTNVALAIIVLFASVSVIFTWFH